MWIALIAFYFGAEVWNGQLCSFTIPSETFPPNCYLRIQLKEGLPFLERTFNLKFKKNWIIQIIGGRGSLWCTTPALRHPNRQKRGNGRRVKRPLSRPHTHVWRVCVDSSLLRPLACPKHTLRHSDIRCTEMKWIDEQIRKKEKWTNPTMNQRVVPDSTLRCQSKQSMEDLPPRSVATGSGWSMDQICQMQKKKIVAAVDGHRFSERHLDGSVVGAAKQSTIFRIPTERIHNTLCDESKTLILLIDLFIYLMVETF